MSERRSYPATGSQSAELSRRAGVAAYFGRPWSHNLAFATAVSGPFSERAFAASVEQVLARHEALRTRFSRHKTRPRQLVVPITEPVVAFHDLRDLGGPRIRRRHVDQILCDLCGEAFISYQAPKLRAGVISLGHDEHIVCVVVDHIAADLYALGVIATEISACYDAAVGAVAPNLSPRPMQYIDFAQSQQAAGTEERDLAFWQTELDGMGSQPALSLPGAKCEFITNFNARTTLRAVPAEVSARVRALTQRHRITAFGVWLSAFVAYAFRETNQADIGILMPVLNRMRPETRNVVGWLANQIIVRVTLPAAPTYSTALAYTWQALVRSLKHQAVACDDPRLVWPSVEQPRGLRPQVLMNAAVVSQLPAMCFAGAHCEPAQMPKYIQRHVLDIRVFEGVSQAHVAATYPVELYDARAMAKTISGIFASIRHLCDEPDGAVAASSSTSDASLRRRRRLTGQTAYA